jgi:hypothetical protein
MALVKNRTRINVKGGGLLKLRELSPTASDTFLDAGYLGGTDLDDAHDMVESKDERGFVIDYKSGGEAPVLKSVLKQSGIDEINLLKNAVGKYYEAYYYVKLQNGNIQEINIPLCKIKPGPSLKMAAATERTLDLEIHMLAIPGESAIVRAPTDYNIDPAVNRYYVLLESATAKGVTTDTAATMWTTLNA